MPASSLPRGFSTLTGHLKEAQFPFAVALAALAVRNGGRLSRHSTPAARTPFDGRPQAVLATAVGYHQFEGMALWSRRRLERHAGQVDGQT